MAPSGLYARLCHAFLVIYCMFFLWHDYKIDEVWQQISRRGVIVMGRNFAGGLMYPITQTGDLWPRGSPWRAKILKGLNNFCNAFLQGGFTDLDEIWHDGSRYLGSRG